MMQHKQWLEKMQKLASCAPEEAHEIINTER